MQYFAWIFHVLTEKLWSYDKVGDALKKTTFLILQAEENLHSLSLDWLVQQQVEEGHFFYDSVLYVVRENTNALSQAFY